MKKLCILIAFFTIASFTSCTDLDDDEIQLFEAQAVDKVEADPRNHEDPDDTEQ